LMSFAIALTAASGLLNSSPEPLLPVLPLLLLLVMN